MKYDRPNDPNAGRLIESLRFLGYGNYEAVADLVDNSIDADGHTISVRVVQRGGQPQISIADDGSGMSRALLDQAMRLGSMTSRDLNSDLGKFGMGLVTASLSIAKNCHVIVRGPDGCWSSAWDVDEMVARNAFLKHLDQATADEAALLDEEVGKDKTGTLVILTKCDNLSNKNTSGFASVLKSHLGRVHRYFIETGRRILVNGEQLAKLDPLQLSSELTEIVIDEPIAISMTDDDGTHRTENVRARIVLVPDVPASELDVNKSMKTQGFYVMRNQREIASAATLNFFTKHNDFNRMRGEIFFPGTLDRLVGIEFTKRQVNLEQSLFDQLATVLVPTCRAIKRGEATKKRVETSGIQQQLHNQAAKAIAEKDKLLIKPRAVIEKREPRKNGDSHRPDGKGERERKNLTRTQLLETRLNCEIREERLGPNGQIYECDREGRKVVLRYNIEHPFYQRFVMDNLGDSRSVTAADFLIYSMATAEIRMLDDGELDAVNNFKAVMSANLRTLLN